MAANDKDDWVNKIPTIDYSDPTITHDRVLLLGNVKFHVRADLLSIFSDYFKTLFWKKFKEAKEKEIEIKEVDPNEFRNFLNILYMVRHEISEDNVLPLVDLAFRFITPCVLDKCRVYILDNTDILDTIELLEYGFKYNLEDIKHAAADFIALEKATMSYSCTDCRKIYDVCHFHRKNFTIKPVGYVVNNKGFLNRNYDRFFALNAEIQNFVFRKIVDLNRLS